MFTSKQKGSILFSDIYVYILLQKTANKNQMWLMLGQLLFAWLFLKHFYDLSVLNLNYIYKSLAVRNVLGI